MTWFSRAAPIAAAREGVEPPSRAEEAASAPVLPSPPAPPARRLGGGGAGRGLGGARAEPLRTPGRRGAERRGLRHGSVRDGGARAGEGAAQVLGLRAAVRAGPGGAHRLHRRPQARDPAEPRSRC